MTYLIIIVAVAALGIGRLWVLQRRQRAKTFFVDEFKDGLGKIAGPSPTPRVARQNVAPARRRPSHPAQPMDPARRAAAKRRLEERRARRVASLR